MKNETRLDYNKRKAFWLALGLLVALTLLALLLT